VEYEELEEWVDAFPFEIVHHDGNLLIDVNGLGYTPEQISALILKKLKESAESYLGQEVTQAVITVPAHFDDNQRTATMEAARMAGLEVLRLINEPTAAALAYGIGKSGSSEETLAVFDFGGGTFDITLLEISGKTFEVLTSTGDNRLGGDDLDNALVSLIVEEFKAAHGVDLTKDPVTLRRLKEVAEKAKCDLSSTRQTTIALPFIAYRDGAPIHLERQLTRDEFEDLIESFVTRTVRCCKRALDDAGISKKDIDKVILVGGSTRIPMVQDAVEDFFGIAPFKGINPDEVVALGAATQAGVFSGNIEEVTLLDVAPHSLGIEVKDGRFSRIIEKNATIPIKAAKNFTTTEDNQTYVNIHILQGESEECAENRSLGKFALTDIPAAPKGRPRVRVTFFVNADGVMEISAEELGSGVAKSLTIVHTGLDENERKSRKKARQRKAKKPGKGGEKRYSPDTVGKPQQLPAGRGGNSDSSSVSSRNADSSVVRVAPEPSTSFAVLGDTNPGVVPTVSQSGLHPVEHINPGSSSAAPTLGGAASITPLPISGKGRGNTPLPHSVNPLSPSNAPTALPISGSPGKPAPDAVPASNFGSPQRFTRTAATFPDQYQPNAQQSGTTFPTPHVGERIPPPAPPSPAESEINSDIFGEESISIAPTQLFVSQPTPLSTETQPYPEGHVVGSMDNRVELPPDVTAAFNLAIAGKETPDAQAAYIRALGVLTADPWGKDQRYRVLFTTAMIRLMMGQIEEFRQVQYLLIERHCGSHGEEVNDLMEKAIQRFTLSAQLRRDRSRLRELLGQYEGACEDMEVVSKTDPQEGDLDRLESLYRARMMKGEDPAAQFKLVKIYLKSNRVDEAIEILQELQHHDAYETRATKILGLCHWQKNLHFLAWQKFKTLNQNDEIRDILYRLANDMESTGQLNNALSVYEHVTAESPEYRDIPARVKKLRYRIKMNQEEADQNRGASGLTDPRFTIIEEINRGSMGIIYKARDKTLDEVVALKVLNDYLCADPGAVERFKREARAAKKLSHPYIVRIHDMFETGSKRFISMEFIDGIDLKRMLSERTSFSEDQLVYYFLQICDALSYAHKLNIIHRDIKPANIMITTDNHVKVTDFGIAKILKGDDSTKSGTAVIGTPLYMAPEQITGEGVDPRSDIYSLGIMMYELVSGHPPFYLGNIEYHHIHTAPPPLPEKVSPMLRGVIMKCVEKNPANRFQSVEQIFNALQVDRNS